MVIPFFFCFGLGFFFCREKRGTALLLGAPGLQVPGEGQRGLSPGGFQVRGNDPSFCAAWLAASGALGRSKAGRMKSLLRLWKSRRICGRGGVPFGEEV